MTAAAAHSSQALRSAQAEKCRVDQSRDQEAIRFHLGQRNRLQLRFRTASSIAGQLGWYAQTLEAGHTRTQSWLLHIRQGTALCQCLGLVLHDNLDRRTDDVVEYHILNSTDLLG